MLLILYGTGSNGHVGHDIVQISHVLRIELFIGGGEACLGKYAHVHLADSDESLVHIRFFLRVRLMKHSFVSLAGGTRLVGVDTRDDDETVLGLFLHLN